MIRHNPTETGLSQYPQESYTESPRTSPNGDDAWTERTIVWAFGHALIQSEATLFYKLRMMLPGRVLSEQSFRMHLERLEAKGYLIACQFQRFRCWRRLVEDADSIGEAPSW